MKRILTVLTSMALVLPAIAADPQVPYGMRGTPTLILIDREGKMRLQEFGGMDDLKLGMILGQLLAESSNPDFL